MKTFAAIDNGVVVDVTVTGGFHPPSRQGVPYVECNDGVQTGDTYAGGVYTRDGVVVESTPKTWTCLEFLAQFTPDEIKSVKLNAPYFHSLLLSAHEIESKDPLTLYAFSELVSAGLFTQERVDQLLQ